MREIKKIIVHCTDTPDGRPVSREEVRQWHLKRGFDDIGYHYLIGVFGEIISGRTEETVGAHCEGDNHDSLGVCVVGRLDFSVAQITSLTTLCLDLLVNHALTPNDIYCHYEFDDNGKSCPNFSGNMLRALITASQRRHHLRGDTWEGDYD